MHKLFILTAFVSILVACGNSENAPKKEITVSAAASLRDAFGEIGKLCEERYKTKVNFNFASSGVLQTQIETGAPVDVFASAGKIQMDTLAAKNLIVAETRKDFARNELVLIVPASRKSDDIVDFKSLPVNEKYKIAVGNLKTVPAGMYAEQTLTKFDLWQKLQPQLIYAEDVRQVLQYVSRGETEAGIVFASDLQSAKTEVRQIAVAPENSHEAIVYPIAVVKSSENQTGANQFIATVLSDEGQNVLKKYGFLTINN
ncbi:MAG: molybdate ABC transporter substrate-binding protein [Pyrinomonadaceae bacterium]|nr:molybdate ABC transporter substrate-binding protein [Pyrinomonadaceae bacterium]